MGEKRRKTIVFLLIGAFILSYMQNIGPISRVYAKEGEPTLGTVYDLSWNYSSTATACWREKKTANYYEVNVFVYYNCEFLGTVTTGTGTNSIDLQQEIRKIIGEERVCATVDVEYTVKPFYLENGIVLYYGEESEKCEREINFSARKKLDPKNVILDEENYTISWDDIEEAGDYYITLYYEWRPEPDMSEPIESDIHVSQDQTALKNGRRTVSIKDAILDISREDFGEQYISIGMRVSPQYKYHNQYATSEITSIGGFYVVGNERVFFPISVSGTLDKPSYIVSWEARDIEEVSEYIISIGYNSDDFGYQTEEYYPSEEKSVLENGRMYVDISEKVKRMAIWAESDLDIYIRAIIKDDYYKKYWPYSDDYVGRISLSELGIEKGETGDDNDDLPPLPFTPHASFDTETYILSWDEAERAADYYLCGNMYIQTEYEVVESSLGDLLQNVKRTNDGRLECSLEEIFDRLGGNTYIYYMNIYIQAWPDVEYSEQYDASYECYVTHFEYTPSMRKVQKIVLSPQIITLCTGNSLYIGKNIYPSSSHYDKIDWTVDDKMIADVDTMGKVTGREIGTTKVHAAIGEATDEAQVTVYELMSNIENDSENENVIHEAGAIIDDIANSDSPNLEKTDISVSELEKIQEDIREGAINGDSFHADVRGIEQFFSQYKENWGQVQKASRLLNAEFEGAYNIEVELYHKNNSGEEEHIGNVIELENEISFTFDLPTGMKELKEGDTKKYVLVRVHKNTNGTVEYEPIDYEIHGDGTFTARSNLYSDFIWVKGVEDPLYISKEPESIALRGGTALFHVEVKGEGLRYEWYWRKDDSAAWGPNRLTGWNTDTLEVGAISARNGFQYRCIVKDSKGNSVTSKEATLYISSVPLIIEEPKDIVQKDGAALFHVKAAGEGLRYEWYWRKDSTSAWGPNRLPGWNTDTLNVGVIAARDHFEYQCVISNKYGYKVTTKTVKLHIGDKLHIKEEPIDQMKDKGTAYFSVKAEGEGLKYEWYWRRDDSSAWGPNRLEGWNTDTLSVGAIPERDGFQYRCIIKDAEGREVVSKTATLDYVKKPQVVKQPEDIHLSKGTAMFHVEAEGEGLKYEWYWRPNASSGWCENRLEGWNTDTLKVDAISARNHFEYKCVIRDKMGHMVTSEAAVLYVIDQRLKITKQPVSIIAHSGTVVFSVEAEGEGLSYEWYWRRNDAYEWGPNRLEGWNTNQLKVGVISARNGFQYYCVVKDASGKTITSNIATLKVY